MRNLLKVTLVLISDFSNMILLTSFPAFFRIMYTICYDLKVPLTILSELMHSNWVNVSRIPLNACHRMGLLYSGPVTRSGIPRLRENVFFHRQADVFLSTSTMMPGYSALTALRVNFFFTSYFRHHGIRLNSFCTLEQKSSRITFLVYFAIKVKKGNILNKTRLFKSIHYCQTFYIRKFVSLWKARKLCNFLFPYIIIFIQITVVVKK